MNIAMHIVQEQQNRSGSSGNRQTNVCCMVAEKPADAISVVVKSKHFLHLAQIIGWLKAYVTFA